MDKKDRLKRELLLRRLRKLARQTDTSPELKPIESHRNERVLLSWSQQRLWFLEQLEDLGSAYHIEGALRLEGELDIEALQATLDTIVARHEALRTVFVRADDEVEPRQVVMPASRFELKQVDLSGQGEPSPMRQNRCPMYRLP